MTYLTNPKSETMLWLKVLAPKTCKEENTKNLSQEQLADMVKVASGEGHNKKIFSAMRDQTVHFLVVSQHIGKF